MGRVDVELYRTFYTEGGFVEAPFGSGYYTLGNVVETPAGSGLYSVAQVTESPEIAGLYIIPDSGRKMTTSSIEGYTVQEDATTIDPSNFFGGAGQITVPMAEKVDTREFFTAQLTLTDSEMGQTVGTVRGMETSNYGLTITADSILGLLNADHQVLPQYTTFSAAMMHYFGQVDLNGQLDIDATLGTRPVLFPGYTGNLWDMLKQIFVAEQVDVSLVDGYIRLRPIRQRVLSTAYYTQTGWTLNNQNTAKKVRVHYYNNRYETQGEVYPVPPTPVMPQDRESAPAQSEPQVYNVDAGERMTFTVQMNASLLSVNQPTCVDFVENRSYAGTNGVYAVSGNDGKPITAAQWTAQGGSLTVRILPEDSTQIEVTITAPEASDYAPYRIAMTAGTGSYYNSLHITGTGVFTEDRYVDLVTGATSATTGEEIGAEVTNPYISTLAQAYTIGARAAAAYALQYQVKGSGRQFVKGASMLGNVAGGRLQDGDTMFRVDTATQTPDLASVDASLDTIMADFNAKVPAGTTMKEFSTRWYGKTMLDFSVAPLKGA